MRARKVMIPALTVILFLTLPVWRAPAETERADTLLRLHVRANSDSPTDQALKYQVRDAVLAVLAVHMEQAAGADAARENVDAAMPAVLAAAQAAVASAGFDYSVSASLGEADFPTRLYGTRVYRAGRYQALQIYLGEGRGENWWCVLFPPLCFVEASPDVAIPVSGEQPAVIQPRSRLLEWLQRIFTKNR